MQPLPGTATEEDVIREYSKDKRLFELMDGVLVEKSLGFRKSVLGIRVASRKNCRMKKSVLQPRHSWLKR